MEEWEEIRDVNLVEELNIPVIGGKLTCFFRVNWVVAKMAFQHAFPEEQGKLFFIERKECRDFALSQTHLYKTDWKITFASNGPDRRYNTGFIVISARSFPLFYDAIQLALERLEILRRATTTGTYHEKVGLPYISSLEVISENSFQGIRFRYSNGTSEFYLPVALTDVERIITALSNVPALATELMSQSEQLK